MRSRLLALALTGAALLPVLSACASTDPDVERREALNAVVEAANAKDADGMRDAVDALIAVVNRQSGTDLDVAEVTRIRTDAQRVRAAAGVIDTDEIERRRLQQEAEQAQEELEEVKASQSAAAAAEASVSASVAASVSASAAAEAERQRLEEEASASATPSPTPSPTVDPLPSLDPGAVEGDD